MKAKSLLTTMMLSASFLTMTATAQQQGGVPEKAGSILNRISNKTPHHPAHAKFHTTGTAQAKTTGTQSRLKAVAYSEYNGSIFEHIDSLSYMYSGTRTGNWDDDMMFYDKYYSYTYDNTGMVENDMEGTQVMDTVNNLVMSRFVKSWNPTTFLYDHNNEYHYTYDPDGNMLTELHQIWNPTAGNFAPDYLYEYAYDPNGNRISAETKTWNPSSMNWAVDHRLFYVYNSAGELTHEMYQTWDTSTFQWKDQSRYVYFYNGGDIMSATHQWKDTASTNWINNEQVLYTYDAAGDNTEMTVKTWSTANNAWENDMQYVYTYDAEHNVTSEIIKEWDGTAYQNMDRAQITYNTFNQPLTIMTDAWDGAAWANNNNSFNYNLYYELFNDGLSVKNLASLKADVYPSPASNFVKVDLNWNEPQTIQIALFDAQGRVVKQFSEKAAGAFSKEISVSDVPAGAYWIKVTGKDGQAVKPIMIMH